MIVKQKTHLPATQAQKDKFISDFAEIVKDNPSFKNNYKIAFFETASKTNYVFNGLNGTSFPILPLLSFEEAEKYKSLKANWVLS